VITKTVGFRIPAATYRELEARGRQEGLSAGQMAQRMVLEALSDTKHAELLATINQLRSELALATMALLADAGKASAEEAEAFVRGRFHHALN
jgi:predicted transposase YdaD